MRALTKPRRPTSYRYFRIRLTGTDLDLPLCGLELFGRLTTPLPSKRTSLRLPFQAPPSHVEWVRETEGRQGKLPGPDQQQATHPLATVPLMPSGLVFTLGKGMTGPLPYLVEGVDIDMSEHIASVSQPGMLCELRSQHSIQAVPCRTSYGGAGRTSDTGFA